MCVCVLECFKYLTLRSCLFKQEQRKLLLFVDSKRRREAYRSLKTLKASISQIWAHEEWSEFSSDNKEVSSDKDAALLGPLQPAQKQIQLLSSDNVPLLIANAFMDVIIFYEESSDISSDNAAALLQSIPRPTCCLYCREPPDHTTVWSG